jgi:hypothetical protein
MFRNLAMVHIPRLVAPCFLSISLASAGIAGYTTPNTGVVWNLDSLVQHSSGTLTGSFPTYTLNDTLTIAPADRVDIGPGSIIEVTQGAGKGLTVLGILRAIGTPGDSIIIRGTSPTAGHHRGIRFEDSSVDSLCVISYTRIQDAVEAVHCLNASPTITHSLFTNNSSNGVRCFNSSPIVRYCTFVENRRNAITVNLNSSPRIEYNLFARNNSENTGARNQVAVGGQGINNPIIRNNEFYNENYFRAGAISLLNIESGGGCAAIVEGNYIHNNSFGILSQGPNMTPIIRYNRIENNRINPDPFVSGSGITVQVGGPTNAPVITGNYIRENYWGITIVSSGGLANSPQPNIGNIMNSDTTDDGWNIFINNHNGGTVFQLYNNGTANIFAQNNSWGSADTATIESWITHQPDSAVFGFVAYLPFGQPGFGPPVSFSVQQIADSLVGMEWTYSLPSAGGGIRILSGSDSLSLQLIATLADTATSLIVQAPFGVERFYGLSSFNRFGEGDTILRRFTIVDVTPPASPTGFVIEPAFFFPPVFELKWRPNVEPDLSHYEIHRSLFDTTSFTFLASVSAPDTLYLDSLVKCDTLYYYRLSAVDTANNRSGSVEEWFIIPCPLDVEEDEDVPREFALHQNYPNPFNPTTTIGFTVGTRHAVSLHIYDMLGRDVATLVSEIKEPGRYRATFDASGLAGGVYFYKLQAAGRTAVRKMMLVK